MDQVVTLVSNVGFPILACFWVAKQNKELTETITKLTSTLSVIDKRLEDLERKGQ